MMVHHVGLLSSEFRILELVQMRKSLTLEQVVTLLPELSWNPSPPSPPPSGCGRCPR